jgi:hypothetical protein
MTLSGENEQSFTGKEYSNSIPQQETKVLHVRQTPQARPQVGQEVRDQDSAQEMTPHKTDFWPLDLFREFGLYGVPSASAVSADARLLEDDTPRFLEDGTARLLES